MKLASLCSSLPSFALVLPNPPDLPRFKTVQKERKKKKFSLPIQPPIGPFCTDPKYTTSVHLYVKFLLLNEKKVIWKGRLKHTFRSLSCRVWEGLCFSSRNCDVLAAASVLFPWKCLTVTKWKRQHRCYTRVREFALSTPSLNEVTAS